MGGSVKKTSERLHSAIAQNPQYLLRYYQRLLKKYNEVLDLSYSEFQTYLNFTLEDFGSFNTSCPNSIVAKISRWKHFLKKEITAEYCIELPIRKGKDLIPYKNLALHISDFHKEIKTDQCLLFIARSRKK